MNPWIVSLLLATMTITAFLAPLLNTTPTLGALAGIVLYFAAAIITMHRYA